MFTLIRGKSNHLKNSRILFKSYKIKSFTFKKSRELFILFPIIVICHMGNIIYQGGKNVCKGKN